MQNLLYTAIGRVQKIDFLGDIMSLFRGEGRPPPAKKSTKCKNIKHALKKKYI